MADDLLADGDPRRALERLWRRGFTTREGERVPGLRDLLERLRRERQTLLDRYSMGDVLEDLRRQLDDVLRTEREGIERRLDEGRRQAASGEQPEAPRHLPELERMAADRRERLDRLPPDLGGTIRDLQDYPFMDLDAWQKFQDLMLRLRQELVQSQVGGLMQAMRQMGPAETQAMRAMLSDLNRMLRERLTGGDPDFQGFMRQWGSLFPGIESLDQLLAELERRAAQMQSLLQSLTPEQRRELEALQEALLQDEGLRDELGELGANLRRLHPHRTAGGYEFQGGEPASLQQALSLMGALHEMDQLDAALRDAADGDGPGDVDPETLRRLLGNEAADQLTELGRLAQRLERAGYLERKGHRWELTPRAIRKIGQRALAEIMSQLRKDRGGRHETDRHGAGGDRADATKRYEFGDPFLLDLRATLGNALRRKGPRLPLRIAADDFEVHRTEHATRCATVLLLDMSRSMIYRECWHAAKRVALALHALIQGQYPQDHLAVVGFSLYARRYAPEVLPALRVSTRNYGTNMQHAFLLARQSLARYRGETKQIILTTDGEPTAHREGSEAYFDYPTTRRTWQLTRAEVVRCTREGITINTFMLEDSPGLTAFVDEMARINRGRALYVTPDRLGQYLLVDFLAGRRKRVG